MATSGDRRHIDLAILQGSQQIPGGVLQDVHLDLPMLAAKGHPQSETYPA